MIPHTPAPQPPAPSHAFVVLAPTGDTLLVERVSTTDGNVAADMRLPRAGARVRHTLTPGPDGTISRFVIEAFAPGALPDAAPARRITFEWGRDTVRAEGATPPVLAVSPGALPWLNPSPALLEQMVRRARALGGATASIPIVNMQGAQPFTVTVTRGGADSVVIAFPGGVDMRLAVDGAGRLTGGVVSGQGVRIVRVASLDAGAGATPRPAPPPDYSAPPGAPYAAEEVRVPTDSGFSLGGTLTMPRAAGGAARAPVVLLLTGSGPQDRDEATPALPGWRPFRQLADTLGRNGIAVLRLDDRGVGGSDAGPAGPTTADFAGDARAAVAWLRARPEIDPARVALLGHSEGAAVAAMVAAGDPAVRAVVLVAGASRTGRRISDAQVAQAFDEQWIRGARRDSLLRLNDAARDSLAAATPWLRFFMSYDPLADARRVRAPTLVLQGATDRQVTAEQAEELAAAVRAGGNRDVTVRVFPDVNHLLVHDPSGAFAGYRSLPSYAVRPDVLGAVTDWLAARIR